MTAPGIPVEPEATHPPRRRPQRGHLPTPTADPLLQHLDRLGDHVTTNASPREQALQATLEHLLVTLPQARLRDEDARAVRKAALQTLSEARTDRPRPRRLRRGLHEVTIALITGIASGSANEIAGELLRSLQHITP